MLQLFKRKHAAAEPRAALPRDVADALEAMTVAIRGYDEETGVRAVVMFPGTCMFTANDAGSTIARLFPGLTPDQLRRAERAVASRIAAQARETGHTRRKNWVHDYGYPDSQ